MILRQAAYGWAMFALRGGREGGGILTVGLYRKLRSTDFRHGLSKRAHVPRFGISRDRLDKVIVCSVPPGHRRTAPATRPKLERFTTFIEQWLPEDMSRPRKQRSRQMPVPLHHGPGHAQVDFGEALVVVV